MASRLTRSAGAATAAILLSMSAAQSGSEPFQAQQSCNYNPNGTYSFNDGASLNSDSSPKADCKQALSFVNCPVAPTDPHAVAGKQQQQQPPPSTCADGQCTYPCPNGDGTCTYTCPPKGAQGGPVTHNPPKHGQSIPPYKEGGDKGGGHSALPWIVGGGLIAGLVAADQLTGKKWASTQDLDANGPRFPLEQKLGRFQVQGYGAGDWPFALDVETEPGTRTWLDVRYQGEEEQSIDISQPEGGRRVAVVQLPGVPGRIGVVRYTVHSAVDRPGKKPRFRPMKIYGIGAGPNAVGALEMRPAGLRFERRPSLLRAGLEFGWTGGMPAARSGTGFAILALAAAAFPPAPGVGSYLSVTAFGPQYPSRPSDVSWSVAARRPFQRSELEVLQLPRDGEGKFVAVLRAPIDLLARTQASGSWSAMPGLTNLRDGTYLLQARAWRTRAGGGDWTGAFAPEYVYIR